MCQAGKTYKIKYKDILIPVKLEKYRKCLGYSEFRMFIGKREIGHHWCVHCKFIYNTCEECIGSEEHKITRALNILYPKGSKLRGKKLYNIFKKEFGI